MPDEPTTQAFGSYLNTPAEVVRAKFDLKEAIDTSRSFSAELIKYSMEQDVDKKLLVLKTLGKNMKILGDTLLLTTKDDVNPPQKAEHKGFPINYKAEKP